MTSQPQTILIHGGGLRSLVAGATLSGATRLAMLFVRDSRVNRDRFHKAFERQADRYTVTRRLEVIAADAGPGGVEPGCSAPSTLRAVSVLAAAAEIALHHKAERLIWPVQAGDDMEALGRAVEALQLVEQMIRTGPDTSLRIEAPLLDLSLRQLVEVGHQMNVPWEMAQSCLTAAEEPCGECTGCRTRHDAFTAAGIEDPLHFAPAHR